jgi:isopenicillin N synthase-like dioxygenase
MMLSTRLVLSFFGLLAECAPIVDMMHWRSNDQILQDEVARQVAIAARDFGFFFVRNHGIPEEISASADKAMHDFFALPAADKQAIAADKTRALKTARGYAGLRDERLDISDGGRPDLKEVLDLGLPLGNSTETYLGRNPWPSSLPHLQEATESYLKASLTVGMELLAVLSRSLGVPENSFAEVFDEPLVVQRLMHYPARSNVSDAEPAEFGCGAHYDFGGLTLLRQSDLPGLQVQAPALLHGAFGSVEVNGGAYSTTSGTFYSDLTNYHANEWLTVEADPELLVVTFGEAMQRLTNGRVQATRHRVVHDAGRSRHSLAVFVDPNPHREVYPLPAFVQDAPMYTPRVAGHKTVLLAAAIRGYLGFGKV